ncbi:OsmC family protein [Echinicola marina]|uniref:OsmC family protein n=1 Tax=Echinicola marina TaxID=2859768 RepID=UPI001CF6319C|nr:OsmC family protein [Echinicola marina]UCS92552.1 OsmC family protein [Echinicola marina]
MKFTRRASANWQGTGDDGLGTVSTQSGVLDKAKYSTKARFADGKGTNPEELVGAAHAGCFSMKLAFVINEKGFTASNIDTEAKVTFEDGKISNIHLKLSASVEGMSDADFQKAAKEAKEECPISKSLDTEITMDAKLV